MSIGIEQLCLQTLQSLVGAVNKTQQTISELLPSTSPTFDSIELGEEGGADTPFIDFHSSASSTNYDFRFIASGGSTTIGEGTLTGIGKKFNLTYGSNGSPGSANPANGYGLLSATAYVSPGTGSADALSYAVGGTAHLNAGTRGIAVGIYGAALCDGTWGPGASVEAGAVGSWAQSTSSQGGTVFGGYFDSSATSTTGAQLRGVEVDVHSAVSVASKQMLALVSTQTDSGAVTGTVTVNGSGASLSNSAYILLQANSGGSATGCAYGLMTIQQSGGAQPIPTTGTLWRAGGFTATSGLDWTDMAFSGNAIVTPSFTLSGAGALNAAKVTIGGALVALQSVTLTAVDLNAAAPIDSARTIPLPTGFTRYQVQFIILSHASTSLTTAHAAVFTGAGGTGVTLVSDTILSAVTSASDATNGNSLRFTVVNSTTTTFTAGTLYFRLTTAQGGAATADVTFVYLPLP